MNRSGRLVFVLGLLAVGLQACKMGINETLYVKDGETQRGDLNSVNGSIIIGKNCDVRGDCRSVNGRIEVGSGSSVEDLQSVNGGISLDEQVQVRQDVGTVNGPVSSAAGVKIRGRIKTLNGDMDLRGTAVTGDLRTMNGDIALASQSTVHGDIIVEEQHGSSDHSRVLDIRLSDGSIVEGSVIVEDDDITVRVHLASGGAVKGEVRGAEVVNE